MEPGCILAPLDAQQLHDQGLLRPGHDDGLQRLHKRRLHRSSDEEFRDLRLGPPRSAADETALFVTIPVTLISRETLCFLGLSSQAADDLWAEWTNWPEDGPCRETDDRPGALVMPFIDFVIGHVAGGDDVYQDDDEAWSACLDDCGIGAELAAAIMDPAFRDLRLTESCAYWIRDTMLMRYAELEDIQETSRERTSLQTAAATGFTARAWSRNAAEAMKANPGHLVLFKGMDRARLRGFFPQGGGDGNGDGERGGGTDVNVEKLLSTPPTHFSGTTALFYFAADHRVAELYASFAARRATYGSAVIVCLTIPHAALDALEGEGLKVHRLHWPSPRWKQLVWRSRARKMPLPEPLRRYRDAVLLIGTSSKGTQRIYEDMQTWEDIGHECVQRVPRAGEPGPPAVQYVFNSSDEGWTFLKEHGQFSVFSFRR